MHRLIRQAIVFFGLLFVVTLVRLPYGSYKGRLLPRLREILIPNRIAVDLDDIVLRFPFVAEATAVRLLIPAGPIPVPFEVDSLQITLLLSRLFLLRTDSDLNAVVYGGELTGNISRPLFGSAVRYDLKLEKLHLDAYPLLKLYGVTGLVSIRSAGETTEQPNSIDAVQSADVTVEISGGNLINPPRALGIFPIPPVRDLRATAHAALAKRRLTVDKLQLDSSLGNARGSGNFQLDASGLVASGSGTINLELSDEGVKSVGGFLALAAHLNDVSNPAQRWTVDIGVERIGQFRIGVHPAA